MATRDDSSFGPSAAEGAERESVLGNPDEGTEQELGGPDAPGEDLLGGG
jgi:hypothetical protein